MNNTISQKIYTSSYVENLYLQRSFTERIEAYGNKDFSFLDDTKTLKIDIDIFGKEPDLKIVKGDNGTYDGENAKRMFLPYRDMPIDFAMNQELWTYLTHNNFREYVLNRFVKKNLPAEGTIKERFFAAAYNSDRALERNAVARLWWAGKLTTNFENDSQLDYFFDDKDDLFFFTKELCSNQNLWVQALGHSFGRNKKLLIAALQHTFNLKPKLKGKQKEFALYICNRIGLYEQNQSLMFNESEEIMSILSKIASF